MTTVKAVLKSVLVALFILYSFTATAQSDGGGKKKKMTRTEQTVQKREKKTSRERTVPVSGNYKKVGEIELQENVSDVTVEDNMGNGDEEKDMASHEDENSPDEINVSQLQISENTTLKGEARLYHNGHEYVDLGLPSGLKWATCNVGADSPGEYGNYYAWGEVETKMPYSDSIFLPAAGFWFDSRNDQVGMSGHYWCTTNGNKDKEVRGGDSLDFYSYYNNREVGNRLASLGLTVRPVYE